MSTSVIHGLTIRPLSPAIGADILDVNVRNLADEVFPRVLQVWHENLVILFRGQVLTEQEQAKFGEYFGGGQLSGGHNSGLEIKRGVAFVGNVREGGKSIGILPDGEMQFHSDQCYHEKPSKGTMLYAMEIPSKGGNTLFANTYAAYESLPSDVKKRLEGLQALNIYDYGLNPTQRGNVSVTAPRFVHPVVRTHPVTKRKALYVNRLMTARIEGIPAEESEKLLEILFAQQERPEFIYEHVWEPGDLVVWDNRCALHARTTFDPSERRLLRRVTLEGEEVS